MPEWIYFLHAPRERFAETITDDNSRSDEGMLAKLKRALAG